MSEVKKFTITGEIKKGKSRIPFSINFSAMTQEQALQNLYAEMGSRHRARKSQITVKHIEEAKKESTEAKA
jgi:ribosomal protein L20A (L18A)